MVDSENSPNNYKTLKISIGTIIKSPKMLKLDPDHLKICVRMKLKVAVNNNVCCMFLIDIRLKKCVTKLF